MPQRKATDLNWYGGPSSSSVWLGLGRLLLPAEFERAEVVRRSRRARAQAQRTQEDAANATSAAVAGNTEGDNAGVEDDHDLEQQLQDGPLGPEERNDTPDGENLAAEQQADNIEGEVEAVEL